MLTHTVLHAQTVSDLSKMEGVSADPARPGFTFAAASPAWIKDVVRLSRDVSSVCAFVVGDGPAEADVNFAGGMVESGGACGFVKEGPGTLKVAGELRISGFITVYDGVLDLSDARSEETLRINLMGDSVLIPPSDARPIEIYLNGERLKSGVWGPSGDAPNVTSALAGKVTVTAKAPSRREIWQDLKYGIFSHYVWNGYGMTAGFPNADGSVAKTIDELADSFDVPNYVNQLVEAGAQYVVFTAWHSGTCPLFPSAAMEKWAPGRPDSPKRDLLGDVLDECHKRGVRPFFYCHPYQPVAEPHNDWINDLFAELVDRYGERLDGLWIDENFQDCTQDKVVDYRRLMRTIKERNPDLVLTHNNGGYQSYGVDQGVQEVQWEYHEGRMASIYQIFNQTAKSPEDMLVTTVIQAAANTMGGGIQWSIDAHGAGGNTRGGLDASARPILDGFVKLFKPIDEAVKNTRPSSSYPPPFSGSVVKLANLSWGVATQSRDGCKEYLHVLKAPAGNSLTLPPAADGKVFANARLLEGGRAVSLLQGNRGLVLTLPDGVSWKTPNTVIVMDAIAPGGVGLVNNTSRAANYLGASWSYQRNARLREFRNDSHRATADGDSFVFTFNGTDVEWISSRGEDRGVVDLAIDGIPQGSVDLSKGSGNFQTVFAKSGLPRGIHTLTGTKRSGAVMTVDAFKVSELINDKDPDMGFSATTWYDSRAASLSGPWEGRGDRVMNGSGFSFTFHGTGVELFAGADYGWADMVVTLDGKPHSTLRVATDQPKRNVLKIEGLTHGSHTIEASYINRAPSGFQSSLYGFMVERPDFWTYQKGRGLGEIQDDVHVSEIKGSMGTYAFEGSGVEIHSTRDAESRTAHYTLDGGGSSLWVGLNHYSPVTIPGSKVFRYPNLMPGSYKVGFTNVANPTGVGFSFVRLNIDAIRVFKGESSSATPLFWGENARGGSGVWDLGNGANWHDGVSTSKWLDLGAVDYCAVFAGKGGTIDVAGPVRVNRLVFRVDEYVLRGQGLELTGSKPNIHIADGAKVIFALPVRLPDGTNLATGTFAAATHPHVVTGGGELLVEAPH